MPKVFQTMCDRIGVIDYPPNTPAQCLFLRSSNHNASTSKPIPPRLLSQFLAQGFPHAGNQVPFLCVVEHCNLHEVLYSHLHVNLLLPDPLSTRCHRRPKSLIPNLPVLSLVRASSNGVKSLLFAWLIVSSWWFVFEIPLCSDTR